MKTLSNFREPSLIYKVHTAMQFININLNVLSSKPDEGIIHLFSHKQRRLILVHCHNERTKVTVGQIKHFESEISNYPVNTLGIYVIDDDTFSKRSLTLANSNKNISLT
ncbi:8567_t:CDS:2 [Dentiscutata erythropus]|uniref:8567_t:CDS:1 n=1 Tax=Dentiscutata erythropus TaxID=1348616 RepID=A0A9N9AQX5_9GLOM|nr:8567_t:CDS:2 [Dentiscutata erythropus]